MKRTRFVSQLLIGLLMTLMGLGWGQQSNTGVITGTVLDASGKPLSAITVTVRRIGLRANADRQSVTTDAQGRFAAGRCGFGNYLVLAVNERPTQVNVNRSLPGNSLLVTVLLSQTQPSANVTLEFGTRVVSVMGRIQDAITGQPVNARLDMQSSASGQSWFSAGLPSNYQILIPRRTNLTFTISAPGYQPWHYPGPAAITSPLNVPVGAKKLINVLMQPTS